MPTLYWGPWLAKIRRGGPEGRCSPHRHISDSRNQDWSLFLIFSSQFKIHFPQQNLEGKNKNNMIN